MNGVVQTWSKAMVLAARAVDGIVDVGSVEEDLFGILLLKVHQCKTLIRLYWVACRCCWFSLTI